MKVNAYVYAYSLIAAAATTVTTTTAFNIPISRSTSTTSQPKSTSLFPAPRNSRDNTNAYTNTYTNNNSQLASAAIGDAPNNSDPDKLGIFSFKTKYGCLNPFAIWYGSIAILLGLPWFGALCLCQLLNKVSNGKLDKMKRLPIFFSQIWGTLLLRMTRSHPKVEGTEILKKFYKENRAAMFVANHNSWMDIPFMGTTIGWKNYKLISKAELAKVPILGRSIKVGGHVMVDRTSRKSQIMTLKSGMQLLKDGIHLCAFPEGTRSKTGRVLPFKNGAFKMAHKVGAPIIPLSIVGSGKAHPTNWMFPRWASHNICKVVIHEPIESSEHTEKELAELVRDAIIRGLPEDQQPIE